MNPNPDEPEPNGFFLGIGIGVGIDRKTGSNPNDPCPLGETHMRIVSRPDFDGIVCAALLLEAEPVTEPILWVQPAQMQKGFVQIRPADIIANLPFDPRCSLWFDHHVTNRIDQPFAGVHRVAPSAAGLIHHHYLSRFSKDYGELVRWTDKIDSADLSMDEVRHPETFPYVLLSMTISGRGDEAPYWNKMVDLLRRHHIDQVMADAEVGEKCRAVKAQNERFGEVLVACTRVDGQVAITDLRAFDPAPEGNRFLVYAIFPDTSVSVKIRQDPSDPGRVILSVGRSIFNPACRVNVGQMLTAFEGGGHAGAGGATFAAEKLAAYLPRIIAQLKANQPNDQ